MHFGLFLPQQPHISHKFYSLVQFWSGKHMMDSDPQNFTIIDLLSTHIVQLLYSTLEKRSKISHKKNTFPLRNHPTFLYQGKILTQDIVFSLWKNLYVQVEKSIGPMKKVYKKPHTATISTQNPKKIFQNTSGDIGSTPCGRWCHNFHSLQHSKKKTKTAKKSKFSNVTTC